MVMSYRERRQNGNRCMTRTFRSNIRNRCNIFPESGCKYQPLKIFQKKIPNIVMKYRVRRQNFKRVVDENQIFSCKLSFQWTLRKFPVIMWQWTFQSAVHSIFGRCVEILALTTAQTFYVQCRILMPVAEVPVNPLCNPWEIDL